MATPIRVTAKEWLDKWFPIIPKDGKSGLQGQRSDILKNEFRYFTNLTHDQIIAKWKAGDPMTTCKDFTRRYCQEVLGIDGTIGNIDPVSVKNYLQGEGKSHAWVDSDRTRVPEVGDICYWKNAQGQNTHVNISHHMVMGVYTDDLDNPYIPKVEVWYTVDGGQDHKPPKFKLEESFAWIRGLPRPYHPPLGTDIQIDKGYSPDLLWGWVSLDLYFYWPDPSQFDPEKFASQQAANDDPTRSLWRSQDGPKVHPDAPEGAGGPGYFCSAGTLSADPFKHGLPHPLAPDARYTDPLKTGKGGKFA